MKKTESDATKSSPRKKERLEKAKLNEGPNSAKVVSSLHCFIFVVCALSGEAVVPRGGSLQAGSDVFVLPVLRVVHDAFADHCSVQAVVGGHS